MFNGSCKMFKLLIFYHKLDCLFVCSVISWIFIQMFSDILTVQTFVATSLMTFK